MAKTDSKAAPRSTPKAKAAPSIPRSVVRYLDSIIPKPAIIPEAERKAAAKAEAKLMDLRSRWTTAADTVDVNLRKSCGIAYLLENMDDDDHHNGERLEWAAWALRGLLEDARKAGDEASRLEDELRAAAKGAIHHG